MSVATKSKAERRQVADEYKERKVPRGIFAVRCAATGEAWVGSSPNLDAARNSLWFQLGAGGYRNALLQSGWKQHGEQAFSLDVLERFDDEISPLLLNETFARKKREWAEMLRAHVL